ncbi:hypothetical protein K469DRAFT_690134 [Zopfia rhizophila CBS 207.26]|uniref:Uncharacterized protein n=1 Tax=Zopfia rhizophila CBS 207.26 TaxID=1314779 RepID=A0A6A6DX96_9PEZI|nr:hypothetical protein K469DRAFT_690134 [Zopfia rhizophila CBS 207.26]
MSYMIVILNLLITVASAINRDRAAVTISNEIQNQSLRADNSTFFYRDQVFEMVASDCRLRFYCCQLLKNLWRDDGGHVCQITGTAKVCKMTNRPWSAKHAQTVPQPFALARSAGSKTRRSSNCQGVVLYTAVLGLYTRLWIWICLRYYRSERLQYFYRWYLTHLALLDPNISTVWEGRKCVRAGLRRRAR